MKNKQRNNAIDIASGFCLIIVVLGHIICFCKTSINLYFIVDLFCFYLAFFFFKAGICFRYKPIKDVFISGLKRLIVPFVCFSFVGISFKIISDWHTIEWMNLKTSIIINCKDALSEMIKMGAPTANLALWFLPSLFICRLLMNYIILLDLKVQLLIAVAIPVVYNYLLFIGAISDISYYCKNIPLGFSLMLYGFLLRKHLMHKPILILSITLYLTIFLICPSHLSVFGGSP